MKYRYVVIEREYGSGETEIGMLLSDEPNAAVSDDSLTIYWNEIAYAESLVINWLN